MKCSTKKQKTTKIYQNNWLLNSTHSSRSQRIYWIGFWSFHRSPPQNKFHTGIWTFGLECHKQLPPSSHSHHSTLTVLFIWETFIAAIFLSRNMYDTVNIQRLPWLQNRTVYKWNLSFYLAIHIYFSEWSHIIWYVLSSVRFFLSLVHFIRQL